MLHDPAPRKKEKSSGTSYNVGKSTLQSQSRWRVGVEAEGVRTGSFGCGFDICKFGPQCVSPFLSCSTLPGSVTPNFPLFSTSSSSASTGPRWECILGWAMPLALASVCRVRGGCPGGGLWLIRMEIVFPSLERWPSVGAAQIFPDTVCC